MLASLPKLEARASTMPIRAVGACNSCAVFYQVLVTLRAGNGLGEVFVLRTPKECFDLCWHYDFACRAGTNNQGNTPRSLWRRSGINAPVELIEGVRDLQVQFGVDTTPNDNIRSPNRYLNFDALNPTDVVRSMRVTITARP